MTRRTRLRDDAGYPWFRRGAVAAKGYAFADDRLLRGAALSHHFAGVADAATLRERAAALNGSFAVVIDTGDLLAAVVDRLRSMPLFYAVDRPAVSDTAKDVARLERVDEKAVAALLHSGYCLGRATLDAATRQLQGGECTVWDRRRRAWRVDAYSVHRRHPEATTAAAVAEELPLVVRAVFERLRTVLDGRTALIPLSGGLDSRLVLAGLLHVGHRAIECFTYGRPTSHEVLTARRVAGTVGVGWTPIGYDRELFADTLVADAGHGYRERAGQLSAIPHWQELPALLSLRRQRPDLADAVVVPGFSGDLLAGSYVPRELGTPAMAALCADGLAAYVLRTHFPLNTHVRAWRAQLEEAVAADVPSASASDPASFVAAHEEWFTRNKVMKFVVNGVRAYEHCGWQWALPLWDDEFAELWYRVPDAYRVDEALYRQLLQRQLFDPLGLPAAEVAAVRRSRVARRLARRLPRPAVVRIKLALDRLTGVDTQDFNAFSTFSELMGQDLPPWLPSRPGESIHQMAVWDYLYRCVPQVAERTAIPT